MAARRPGMLAAEDYVVNRYHKPQDEYNANWDWSGAVADVTLYFQLGRQLAAGQRWPNWYKRRRIQGDSG